METDCDEGVTFSRNTANIQDFCRFHPKTDNYNKQFCNLYKIRLSLLKERLLQKVNLKWGTLHPIVDIVELVEREDEDGRCIIIGTLYKEQELKPSVIKEISEELQLPTQPKKVKNVNYSSMNDCLYLEDDVQRIKLTGNLSITKVVTGIICAILGQDLKNGTFRVDDWCFPGYCPRIEKSMKSRKSQCEGNILLVSGLDFANNLNTMSLNLLQEWITGMAGNKDEQQKSSKLIAVIIAGNSIRNSVETFSRSDYFEKNAFNSTSITEVTLTIKKFDDYLSQILENCHVILLPGEFDPSSHLIPQRPLHRKILQKSARYTSLHTVTNPWIGEIQSRVIAGSSGQPISDIMKLADVEDLPVEWMEKTLMWQHYAPTSPDTLDVYPYYDTDPFVIQECPDIYFAGNMKKYDTQIVSGDNGQITRLICIPQFCLTQTAVLVNLRTLDVSTISFGTNL